MSLHRCLSLSIAAATLLGLIAIQLWFSRRMEQPPAPEGIPSCFSQLNAHKAPGWRMEVLPLSDTELGRHKVERALQYDAAAFCRFFSADKEFTVLVLHWHRGKASPRAVNAHTPDVCWIRSGWQLTDQQSGFRGARAGIPLVPGEYRCFQKRGVVQHVAFWHLVGGEPVAMARNGSTRLRFLRQVFTADTARLKEDQFFIRVASPSPLQEIWSDPVLTEVLQILAPTGLVQRSGRSVAGR